MSVVKNSSHIILIDKITNPEQLLKILDEKRLINLDRNSLKSIYKNYKKLAEMLKQPISSKNVITDLLCIKRNEVNSGPYPHVSFFEAANRICSDLTLLHGCAKLFDEDKDNAIRYFECCLGTKQGIDLIGKNDSNKILLRAEVFCTSEKFFKAKFYKEKSKGCNVIVYQKLDSSSIHDFISKQKCMKFFEVDIEKELPSF